ncbi:MAG: glycosyltransferase [Planctomycetota bacterium]
MATAAETQPQLVTQSGPRVMLVTRHFWPHASGQHETAAAAMRLARFWADGGMAVEVVTPKYESSWPSQFVWGSVIVHRLAVAPRSEWSNSRYVRLLGQWLNQQSERLDAIVGDQMREDVPAIASVASVSENESNAANVRPTRRYAICGGVGHDGDLAWCQRARAGTRTMKAITRLDQIITTSSATDRALMAQGIADKQLHRMTVPLVRHRAVSTARRNAARKALALANSDMATTSQSRVLLWCGSMEGRPGIESGIGRIVGSARLLLARYPDMRLWLIGDGPLRDWAHTELRAEGVRSLVAMPGSFPDMTDVMDSVDGVIATDAAQVRDLLWDVMRRAIPLIAPDDVAFKSAWSFCENAQMADCIAWYSATQPKSLRKAVRAVWDDLPTSQQLATGLADYLYRTMPATECFEQWRLLLGCKT